LIGILNHFLHPIILHAACVREDDQLAQQPEREHLHTQHHQQCA